MAAIRAKMHQGIKLSKGERKMLKKQNKAFKTLKTKVQEVGEISHCPTPYLLVKNGGLMCGVKRQDILGVFQEYGTLEDLVMLPGKSYCYVLYSSLENAEKAVMNLNGRKLLNEMSLSGTILYLAYLTKKPCLHLCTLDQTYPSGMILIEDFIGETEESVLLKCFSNCQDMTLTDSETSVEKQLRHRYVKHYGYEFLYGSNTVDKERPLPRGMPSECSPVMEKIVSLECVKHRPDQLTINEYLPGQGIPPHIDTHSAFEDGIICLSLGAKVAMDFRHPDGRHVSILLPRRSILVMTEDSRYVWTHGITPRKYDVVSEDEITRNKIENTQDQLCVGELAHDSTSSSSPSVTLLSRETRLSLTFRKVRRTPCDCKFPASCDSQDDVENPRCGSTDDPRSSQDCPSVPVSEEDAIALERKHVYNVYENIAEHFSGTRHSPWPRIADFLKAQPLGSIVADVGCGNGKYLSINDQLFMTGSDRSTNLASICRERGFQVIVCDILSLPYRSKAFDVCICIAVVHHLSTPERRLAALKELVRIVRPGGHILVSVWAFEQNLNNAKPEKVAKVTQDHGDYDVPTEAIQNVALSTGSSSVNHPDHEAKADIQFFPNLQSTQQTSAAELTKSTKHDIPLSKTSSCKLKVNASRDVFEQQDLLVPWHYRGEKKPARSGSESSSCAGSTLADSKSSQGEEQPRTKKDLVYQRFYHVYKEDELVVDCRKLDNISVVRSYYDKGNWCVELAKLGDNEQCGNSRGVL